MGEPAKKERLESEGVKQKRAVLIAQVSWHAHAWNVSPGEAAQPAHLSCSSTSTHSCIRPLRTSDQALFSQPFLQPSPSPHVILLISMPSLHGVPSPFSVPNRYSIPIVQRVRRNRQRLPSSLLIENASDPVLDSWTLFCPRHFRSSLATFRPSDTATFAHGT